MGRAIIEEAVSVGIQLVPVSFSTPKDSGQIVQVGGQNIQVYGPSEREGILASIFEEHPNLIVVDYTVPDAVNDNAELYCKVGVPFVSELLVETRRGYILDCRRLKSLCSNFSTNGKTAMEIMSDQFPGAFPGYSLQLTSLCTMCGGQLNQMSLTGLSSFSIISNGWILSKLSAISKATACDFKEKAHHTTPKICLCQKNIDIFYRFHLLFFFCPQSCFVSTLYCKKLSGYAYSFCFAIEILNNFILYSLAVAYWFSKLIFNLYIRLKEDISHVFVVFYHLECL